MTAVDVYQVVIFDDERTYGLWGDYLRALLPPRRTSGEPRELRARIREYLVLHPMLTIGETAAALGMAGTYGTATVRRCLNAMELDGEANRHEGALAERDRRNTVRWTA